jgi:hypothetical protein
MTEACPTFGPSKIIGMSSKTHVLKRDLTMGGASKSNWFQKK